jgi:protease-4
MIGALLLSLALGAGIDDAIALPTDVTGYARGADAVGFDPAAPALADGLELQVRGRLVSDAGAGRLGVFGVWATPVLTPFAGFEWRDVEGPDNRRATLGLAVSLGDLAAVGIAYRRYSGPDPEYDGADAIDLGVAAEPFSWLSLAAGVDTVNAPSLGGAVQDPAFRIGAAVRPLDGAPEVTLGGDMRWRAEPLNLVQSRLFFDLAVEGLHATVAWEPQEERVWLGFSVALWNTELRAAAVPTGFERGSDGWKEWGLAVTMRQWPAESVIESGGRVVELAVTGDLRREDRLFDRGPAVSTLTQDLDQLARDERIATVVLHVGEIDVGIASVEEVRAAIFRLRARGKQVVARLTNADDRAYLVASAADAVQMDPATTLRLDGFAIKVRYFAEALAKLGVRFDTVEIGRAKSGADPLARTEPR